MEQAVAKERFEVIDESSAQWVLERLAELIQSRDHIMDQHKMMVAKYDAWKTSQLEEIDEKETYFKLLLQNWATDALANGKKKSISLPSGKVGYRAANVAFTFNGNKIDKNDTAFIELIKGIAPDNIETKESVKWADFKQSLSFTESGTVVTADGEIVEGLMATQGEPTFYVKVEG